MTLRQRFLRGMTVHLVKLCVGCDTVQELKDWQTERLKRLKRAGKTPEHCHRTSQTPRRRDELLDGGSLYWVIRGEVLCRQRLIDVRPFVDEDGIGRCQLVLAPKVIATQPRPCRPFQGWRYFPTDDAPKDLDRAGRGTADMPEALRRELRGLGLL